MELLLNFCYYITLFLIPISIYVLLFQQKTKNRFHTNRGKKISIFQIIYFLIQSTISDWFYVIKYLIAKSAIKKYQNKIKKHTENLQENVKNHKIALFKFKFKFQYNDCHLFYGADQKGNSLSLKFQICSNLVGEVFLCLRLATGAIYTFPGKKL